VFFNNEVAKLPLRFLNTVPERYFNIEIL